ncbi:solute carrier family 35 member F2 isoform X1 [Pseudopipra pipra]|uniref:solute carrier family 35 member F2 isoform X1 n=1 Tax=Pseudopipra pipra TaxID=415032 RepID=UPI003138E9D8
MKLALALLEPPFAAPTCARRMEETARSGLTEGKEDEQRFPPPGQAAAELRPSAPERAMPLPGAAPRRAQSRPRPLPGALCAAVPVPVLIPPSVPPFLPLPWQRPPSLPPSLPTPGGRGAGAAPGHGGGGRGCRGTAARGCGGRCCWGRAPARGRRSRPAPAAGAAPGQALHLLLDCFGIPVLMALSWFILRARYRLIHFLGVAVCLLGVGTMVGADILAGRQDSEGSDVVIGDVLVLLGASLYAISNVSEEYIVKNLSRVEFLGMVGLFGTIVSGLQLAIVEHREIMRIQWNWKVALLFTVFALCMFGLYSFMPVVIKVTSATSVNLGILTADLYSLFFGLFLFYYKFSGLYILSFVIIMVGFILYCSTPTLTAEPTALPQPNSTGLDNAGLKLEEGESETPTVTVQFTRGETVSVRTD